MKGRIYYYSGFISHLKWREMLTESHLFVVPFVFQKNKNKKKGKDEKCGSEVTTPENSSSPGMMDMHDDNSNQSSIADASPIKQENSSNSSPAPEQNLATQADGTEVKSDETQTEAKEQPGSEGKLKGPSSKPNKKCYSSNSSHSKAIKLCAPDLVLSSVDPVTNLNLELLSW
uniref:B-cell CLL/lymphoma 7 protein family member A n=1 Tax=Otus sunia TaxID=257818 RepID=A0A8C8A4Z7_9STRI